MRCRTAIEWLLSNAVLALLVAGCGGGDGDTGPPPGDEPLVVQKAPTNSGDGQTGTVGEALGAGLRILITRAAEPEAGVGVQWATANGGSLAPATSTSGADGIATTNWTLGPAAGAQTATATVADADGSPVSFTATAEEAPPPPPAARRPRRPLHHPPM